MNPIFVDLRMRADRKWRDGHRRGFDRRGCIRGDSESLGNFRINYHNQWLIERLGHRTARETYADSLASPAA